MMGENATDLSKDNQGFSEAPEPPAFDDDGSVLLYKSDKNESKTLKNGNISSSDPNATPSPYLASEHTSQTSTTIDASSVNVNHESRVTRLLRTRKVRIHITEAGNSNEGLLNSLKKYVVYTIKLVSDGVDEIQTRRRYSDFESLRELLTRIFPLVLVPPIPQKNYFNLTMLNGLVAGSNAASGGPGANTQYATGAYINLSHLAKDRLIEHRKRLLSNFLNSCLQIQQVRNLEFFAKFLDPNANWSDETTLISSHLPKSVYLLNPENGLKTDPLYKNLPLPVSSHAINLPFLKPLLANSKKITKKTTRLLSTGSSSEPSTVSAAAESEASEVSPPANESPVHINTSNLDEINRKVIENFIGLASDYTDLGTIFNSFSLVLSESPVTRDKPKLQEDEGRISLIFDKVGQIFDRSYVTLNLLIGELETKFSEPLGEAVQYLSILQTVTKFKERKVRQSNLLNAEVKDKKKDLEYLLKVEEAGRNGTPAPLAAEVAGHSEDHSKYKLFPSFKKLSRYVSDIMDQNPDETRKQKIVSLRTKIVTLEKCQSIMLEDISYITDELDKNVKLFHNKELKVIYEILLTYNGFLLNWGRKNIEIWEEIREEVKTI